MCQPFDTCPVLFVRTIPAHPERTVPHLMSKRRPVGTLVIQDRSRLFRESLLALMPTVSTIKVLGVVADPMELIDSCHSLRPDAALFESIGASWSVGEVVAPLVQQLGEPVLVGTYPHEKHRHQGLEGVTMVSRTASCRQFALALQGSDIDTDIEQPDDRLNAVSESLTRREFQVLALIGGGYTTAQIARRIGLSPKTVESRRQSLFAKLGVQNQSHAIAVAMRTGLLGSGPISSDDR
jgi:DNA-binding NarL/FixJ family response regulator